MGTERVGDGNWERRGWELGEKGKELGEKGMGTGREGDGNWETRGLCGCSDSPPPSYLWKYYLNLIF